MSNVRADVRFHTRACMNYRGRIYSVLLSVFVILSGYLISYAVAPNHFGSLFSHPKILLTQIVQKIIIVCFCWWLGKQYDKAKYYSGINSWQLRELEERKTMELKLRESDQRYSSLIEHNPDGILIADRDGNISTANPAAELLFGYTQAELRAMHLDELFDYGDPGEKRGHYDKTMEGEALTYVASVIRKYGGTLKLSVKNVPLVVYGTVAGMHVIVRDITRQTQAEYELREAKEMLESFVKHNADSIAVVSADQTIISVNDAFIRMYGYEEHELIGRSGITVPDSCMNEAERIHEQLLAGRHFAGLEGIKRKKDNTLVDVSMTLTPVRNIDGNVVSYYIVERDISERKRMERALRDSEAKFRLITENMTDIIMLLDQYGTIGYISPSCQSVLGFSPDEYIGKSMEEWANAEERVQLLENWRQTLLTRRHHQGELQILHRESGWVVLETLTMPVVDPVGEIHMFIVVARDNTEKKRTEELLRKTEKLSVVGQLAAGVAHEIRNPLTSLKGFMQLIRSRTDSFHEYIEIMLSELERINMIVSEFMVIAKPQIVRFEERQLPAILRDVISLLDTQAIINNVQIKYSFDLELPIIKCDENQLKQVFINVLKNAIEAMPSGGEITVELKPIPYHLLIRISDQGMGIPLDRIPKLGEPFYTTKERGTGLGLMVCYKIIEAHRGRIRIESRLNVGTTVNIELPVA